MTINRDIPPPTGPAVQREERNMNPLRTVEVERHDGLIDTFETDQAPWMWREFLCVGTPGQHNTCDYIPVKAFRSFTVIEHEVIS